MARALCHFNGKPTLSLSKQSHFRPSSSSAYKPTRVTMAQAKSYWASIEADIQDHLKTAIPIRQPVSVFEPMHHLVFAAPKAKAPALCVAACELVGGDRAQAMIAASALHLVHSAAHTHEHLPLTDRPNPRPMVHHDYGPNIELLFGDGIVPFGLELLARSVDSGQNDSDRVLRVILEITRAIGSQGMIDGQYQELQGIQSTPNEEWIEHVCRKKEGELHACGAACGAILGGGSEEEIETLRRFGLYVGVMEGMLSRGGGNEKGLMEVVERMRVMATNELENLKGRNVEPISSILQTGLCTV